MDIQQLLYFVTSVDNGSISGTAQELNVSQPTITKSIQKLEAEVQALLIERHGKGVKATTTGEALYRHAKAILNQVQRATNDIEFSKGNRPENLLIGCSPSFIDHMLPTILASFLKLWPTCTVTLKTAHYSELITTLKNGEVDAILAFDILAHSLSDIHYEVLGQNELVFIVNPAHPLVGKGKLSIAQIHAAKWIILDAPDALAHYRNLFEEKKLVAPEPMILSQSLSLVKSMLISNELIGFLPQHMVDHELDNGTLIKMDVDIPVTKLDLILAHNESLFPSAMLKAFLEVASQVMSNPKQYSLASGASIQHM